VNARGTSEPGEGDGTPERELTDEELLGTLRTGELALKAAGALVLLMALLAALAYAAHDPLVALAERFVEIFGPPGIALGFFLPDAFTLPIPNDAFSFFGLIGGIPFWTCVKWGCLGSLTGGSVGFFLGRKLSHTRVFQRMMARRGREVKLLVERYGVRALLCAAVTPLPYSIACWSAGACAMPYGTFVLVSLARIPRVIFYLWLIEVGFLTFSQAA
jgi:membrane protein YqaA with SNARE-associated domain